MSNQYAPCSQFHFTKQADAGYTAAAVSDFNGDGKAEIVWVNPQTGSARIWCSDGIVSTFLSSDICTLPGYIFVGAGMDGMLLWLNPTTRDVWRVHTDGTAALSGASLGTLPAGYNIVAAGQKIGQMVDHSIILQNAAGDVRLWSISSAGVVTDSALGNFPGSVFGFVDTAAASGVAQTTFGYVAPPGEIYFGCWDGSTLGSTGMIVGTPVFVGDFTNDGGDDILLYNSSTRDLYLMSSAGQGWQNYAMSGLYTVPAGLSFVGAGDMEGDGFLDLVFQNPTDRTLTVLYGSVTGTQTWSGVRKPPFSFNQAYRGN